jgi:peptidoglycan/xylan/chitin deacetylase (PgdA/CDA1 family)
MSQPSLTIFVYHYVRDTERTAFPDIHAVSVARFRRDVAFLKSRYTPVSLSDYMAAREGKRILPERSCLLSFDDGVKDHVETVLPMLVEEKVPAVFYVISATLRGEVPSVQKIHFLLAKLGTRRLVDALHAYLEASHPDRLAEFSVDEHVRKSDKRFGDVLEVNLKHSLSTMPEQVRDDFLAHLFSREIGREQDFAREVYASRDDLLALRDAGMEVGAHSDTHPLFTAVDPDRIRREIMTSRDALAEILGSAPTTFSYPYGKWTPDAISSLRETGFTSAVTITMGENGIESDPFLLCRMNANDIPAV